MVELQLGDVFPSLPSLRFAEEAAQFGVVARGALGRKLTAFLHALSQFEPSYHKMHIHAVLFQLRKEVVERVHIVGEVSALVVALVVFETHSHAVVAVDFYLFGERFECRLALRALAVSEKFGKVHRVAFKAHVFVGLFFERHRPARRDYHAPVPARLALDEIVRKVERARFLHAHILRHVGNAVLFGSGTPDFERRDLLVGKSRGEHAPPTLAP